MLKIKRFGKLPDDALEAIAEQVGRLYPPLDNSQDLRSIVWWRGFKPRQRRAARRYASANCVSPNSVTRDQPPAALTETFPVWTLSTDAIDTGKGNLSELAQDTYRWHSQILIDGKPEGVARSAVSRDGDVSGWAVKQVLKGDLARTVDDAIRWIDTKVATDPLVHILEVPAFFITALWLIDGQESSIVIAKCPESLQELNRLVQYPSQEFLEILRRESPAVGIRDERPQPQHRPVPEASQRNSFNVLSINTNVE